MVDTGTTDSPQQPAAIEKSRWRTRILKLYLPVVVACILFNVIAGVSYPSARLANPTKIAPEIWIGEGSYYGILSRFGRPFPCFAMRKEAKIPASKSDLRTVAVRFSLIGLLLDIVVWIAPLLIARSFWPDPRVALSQRCTAGDNPALGLILCTDKNDTVVKYTLGADQSKKIFASRYKLYLPSEDELRAELRRELRMLPVRESVRHQRRSKKRP